MMYRQYRLPPGAGWMIVAVVALVIFALISIPAQVAGQSFERLGLSMLQGLVVGVVMFLWRKAAVTVYLSKKLVSQQAEETLQSFFLQMQHGREPERARTGELVRQRFAVSVGGAVVPLVMCLYFAIGIEDLRLALPWLGAGIILVGGVCFAAIENSPGYGLRVSWFIPPVAVLAASLLIRGEPFAPQVTYISAVLGILFGTGILPLLWPRMRRRLDAPSIVIGGPGVFSGLFLACLAAGLFS